MHTITLSNDELKDWDDADGKRRHFTRMAQGIADNKDKPVTILSASGAKLLVIQPKVKP